ncbi:hypothetical protein TNCT_9341 [Trichonephila clavata]|uniref:Uncharacterized protein n=1 Tax=Trichonephila clavata TaxID=2740835 RepID=A0A8X6HN68_TRICU|nr:hypothetical protein TNCT_9341 [Trichonephila clavata]
MSRTHWPNTFSKANHHLKNGIELKDLGLTIETDLILLKKLKILLSSLVKPIGGRIKYVIRKIYGDENLPNHFMSMISWTILVIIDEKKTAEAIIKDENLPLSKRYEISCTYCMHAEIPMLWHKLPQKNKSDYLKAREPVFSFPIYWIYMKMELNILDRRIREVFVTTPNSDCFGVVYSFKTENLPAFEYFLAKLSAGRKKSTSILFSYIW